jgi:hypothetical protein
MAVGKIEGTPETASVGHDILDGRPREPARPARGTSEVEDAGGQERDDVAEQAFFTAGASLTPSPVMATI